MFDLKKLSEGDVFGLLAKLTDLSDGDIDNPETAESIKALSEMVIVFVTKALSLRSSFLATLVAPIVAGAIRAAVAKFIVDKTAKPA